MLTKRNPRKTLNPSTNSNMMSTKLADTMIKSNMFQPHRKKSLERASNLMMHSNAKIDVKTYFGTKNGFEWKIVVDLLMLTKVKKHTLLPMSNACRIFSLMP